MAYKLVLLFALVALVSGGIIVPDVPLVKAVTPLVSASVQSQPILTKVEDEYDPHPQYKYAYDVQDTLSGDSKSLVEERDGDVVRGEYSLIDPDGFKRVVQYTSDPLNGFNAIVNRIPLSAVPGVVKTVVPATIVKAPVALAAPIVKAAAAPAVLKTIVNPAVVTKTILPAVAAH